MAVSTIKAVAGRLNIEIEQGTTFSVPLTWSDETGTPVVGLNTWTARMQIRDKISSATMLFELTTLNGGITLGSNVGEILLFISDTDTTSFTWTSGVYDLEMISPTGAVTRLLQGNVKIIDEVTR